MYLSGKRLNELSEQDLQGLVDVRAQEGESADFKAEVWATNDEGKRKMLRDLASMANRRGGEIYIGISEHDGSAVELHGVGGEGHAERIIQSCRANIEPALSVEAQPVSVGSDRNAIVVRIPRSLSGPHMITFGGLNQFWIRHGRTTAAMTVEEIEEAYYRRLEGETKLERYLDEQWSKEGYKVGSDGWLSLVGAPVFLRRGAVNVADPGLRELLREPPINSPASTSFAVGTPRRTLDGLSAEHVVSGQLREQLELHSNGFVHFGKWLIGRPADDEFGVPAFPIACYLADFVHLCFEIWRQSGLVGPFALSLRIFNAAHTWLNPRYATFVSDRSYWEEPILTLPLTIVQAPDEGIGSALKELNDTLWAAYRFDSCWFIFDDGSFHERVLR